MVVNGLIGTVLSELLWLLGCFYTSSLVATLAISLTIPLTMLADVLVKERCGIALIILFFKEKFSLI